MRQILFRGQTRRYGEKVRVGDGAKLPSRWVYGGVLQGSGNISIIYGGENMNDPSEGLDKWPVYTGTVGQYTGLTDKNGTRIFEGDIVEGADFTAEDGGYGVVEYNDGAFEVNGNNITGTFHDNYWGREFEVIGNIHDNPELFEGEPT